MPLRNSLALFTLGVVSVVAQACSGDRSIPSARELSEALVTADDLEGEWAFNPGPQGGEAAIDPSGILTDEQRDLLPSFELCDRASDEAKKIASTMRPLVFRQLDLAEEDEIDPPFDRTGHMIFLQEFLYTDASYRLESSFESLRDGMTACFGEMPAGEEGPGFVEALTLPDIGDDRFGALMKIEEAGGWAEWHIQEALVRDGATFMKFVMVDIRAGVEPYFSADDFAGIVQTAVNKL